MEKVNFVDLGCVSIHKTLDIQSQIFELRTCGRIPDTVIFVEHNPVISFGRRKNYNNFSPKLINKVKEKYGEFNRGYAVSYLKALGIDFIEHERGGGATYFGPGQLSAYLVLDLERLAGYKTAVGTYQKMLDKIMLSVIRSYGINAISVEVAKKIGDLDDDAARHDRKDIWVVKEGKNYKIGAKGIKASGGITLYGFNIFAKNKGLTGFEYVLACGYEKHLLDVTSIETETKKRIRINSLKRKVQSQIAKTLNYEKSIKVDINDILEICQDKQQH